MEAELGGKVGVRFDKFGSKFFLNKIPLRCCFFAKPFEVPLADFFFDLRLPLLFERRPVFVFSLSSGTVGYVPPLSLVWLAA
jgi:hypothetical protein